MYIHAYIQKYTHMHITYAVVNSGGDLARIKSEAESSKILIELQKFNPSYILSMIWISLTNFEMDMQNGK